MISLRWRERLTYLAMSLVVAWQSLAIIVAPAPDGSATAQSLRFVLEPYLSILRLDNAWNFFAPSVGRHAQFRYVIEDGKGTKHTFVPTEERTWSIPHYVMWREFKYLYEGIMEAPEVRGDAIGAFLCQQHAALDPMSVSLVQIQEGDFAPEDYLRGKHPLDPELSSESILREVSCRDRATSPERPAARTNSKKR